MPPAAAIRAERLTRRFGVVTALDGLDLTIESGEAVAVLGPNGAGKTTLLRVCSTLLRASSGRVHVFGTDLARGSAAVRRRLGVLSHQSYLYPELTPVENLEFYARMYGVAPARERVDELISHTGLGGWAHRPVRTLSRGLEQRCALARALLHRPDLLLLDEPFSGLDLEAAQQIESLLREERARGVSLLLTTHDLERGFSLCERGIVLRRGALRWDGRLADLDRGRVEELFFEERGSALAPAQRAQSTQRSRR
jgi:heme exporter protein A